ncbi:cyclic nucleotide-binding protein [Cereibacter johrii]|uniref:Acb2/Tad1 domain-containing protein n=1 Tax=Cereibacter johrii TaxID=445629 RepID=UPI002B25A059|nr:cyclic nucleotide-binding protein [Cereibacter johrii]MEA5159990.1 cyclic nucleotide-binding protein [Cereibacter johrii]
MKENQHFGLPVPGYRPQSDEAVAAVKGFKEIEERVLRMLDHLAASDLAADGRWLAFGRTQIEQGFMAVNRSIFKPQRAVLPEDRDGAGAR